MAAKAVKEVKEQSEEDKKKSPWEKALEKLEKDYGKGTIINANTIQEKLEVVSTGSINFDVATHCMGIPLGKLIEYQGMESSGKSTASLHNIAEFQKKYPNDKFIYVDYEHSFDRPYAESVGVNIDKLVILQPNCSEDGYNQVEELIKTGSVRLVIIDSHSAAQPKVVVDGLVGQAVIGMQARINSTALGKIKPLLGPNRCTMIGISQIRQNIGSMGEVNISTGGLSWRFYADMRVKFARIQTDKEHEANKTEISVFKNKCAVPWGKAVVYINWGQGYDRIQEVIDAAVEFGYIKKGGSWYTLEDGNKVQGDEALIQLLEANEEYYQKLEAQVLDKIKNPQQEVVETAITE